MKLTREQWDDLFAVVVAVPAAWLGYELLCLFFLGGK